MHLCRIFLSLACLCSCLAVSCTGNSQAPPQHQRLKELCEPFKIEPELGVTPAERIDSQPPFVIRPGVEGELRDGLRRQGVACLHLTISTDGRVSESEIVYTDNPAFAEPFRDSTLERRYEPAKRGGKPIETKVMVSSSFTSQARTHGRTTPSRPGIDPFRY